MDAQGWQTFPSFIKRNHFFLEGRKESVCGQMQRRPNIQATPEIVTGYKCVGCLSRYLDRWPDMVSKTVIEVRN